MDARQYDRIADLLMQIRAKIAEQPPSHSEMANETRSDMLHHIDILLAQNDSLGKADAWGLI